MAIKLKEYNRHRGMQPLSDQHSASSLPRTCMRWEIWSNCASGPLPPPAGDTTELAAAPATVRCSSASNSAPLKTTAHELSSDLAYSCALRKACKL